MVDIDGVISLFGFDPRRPPPGRFLIVDGIPHLLSETAAGHLRRLADPFELVWCSGWEEKADEYLPFALGLPAGLHHLCFEDAFPGDGRHWKLTAIDRYAGPRRPLAWIDDAHDDSCRAWSAARPAPTLLLATDPAVGLTDRDADRLAQWARMLSEPPG